MEIIISAFLTNFLIVFLKHIIFNKYINDRGYRYCKARNDEEKILEVLFLFVINLMPVLGTLLTLYIWQLDHVVVFEVGKKRGKIVKDE